MSVHSLMFGWEYPPMSLGGLGVACQGLVKGLLEHDIKITLALPHSNGVQDEIDIVYPTEEHMSELKEIIRVQTLLQPYDGVDSYADRISQFLHKSEHTDMNDIYGADLHQAIAYFTEMSVEMTKHVKPDVVHCHDWMTYEAGARAAAYHNVPLISHIHATELDRTHFSPNNWIYQKELQGFQKSDKIIAVSNYTKSILIDHYGIDPNKIEAVHNGTTDVYCEKTIQLKNERSRSKKHAPMILFLGRLALQKGSRQFLDMAAQIHKIRPDVQFVVAGSGHMEAELINKSIELGLQNNMVFAGKVNNEEARKLYSEADCFVMPSLSEPFGLVALEAIAQGTPVILSRQSGASEVIAHSFVVDFWDTARMADCALTILREDALATQLRSEAAHILKDLTWKNQAAKVKSIYHGTIDY